MSHEVPAIAEEQAGVFTRAQARAAGWTDRQVTRRLASRAWCRVAGAALAGREQPIEAWQLAYAVHLSWPRAVISHELAGRLWGLPVRTAIATATAGVHDGLRSPGLHVTRRPLPTGDVTRIGELAITTRIRTAVDLLAALPYDEASRLWAWVVTREVLTLGHLDVAIRARRGLTGTPQLRRILESAATGALSPAEERLHDILRGSSMSGWRANARVVVGGRTIAVVDVLFARQRLVIEVDGWAWHGGQEAFQRDRQRQNALVGAGYTVLRFTWDDVAHRADAVAAQIRAALARAA